MSWRICSKGMLSGIVSTCRSCSDSVSYGKMIHDVDREIADMGRGIDPGRHLLFVERDVSEQEIREGRDDHHGNDEAVAAGHFGDHDERGYGDLGDAGEEPSHADEDEGRGLGHDMGKERVADIPESAAEHGAYEEGGGKDAAASARADGKRRGNDLCENKRRHQRNGELPVNGRLDQRVAALRAPGEGKGRGVPASDRRLPASRDWGD